MAGRSWRRLDGAERAELWRRWKRGESLTAIASALGRRHTTVQAVVSRHGGFAPVPAHRADRALTLSEREEISRDLCVGISLTRIAQRLGRSPSTVCREVARNGGAQCYRAAQAEQAAWDRARRPKLCLLARQPALQAWVAEKLMLNWSPEQISQRLEVEFANDDTMQVSHETIYRSLFIQARGVLKKQLMAHLRSGRSSRRPKASDSHTPRPGQISEAVSIRERPAEADDRAVPGHWEGDLLCGSKQTQIATLVERHSRFVLLVKVTSKDTDTVVSALSQQARQLPQQWRRSLTWDRGLELAKHKSFTLATDMQVYFCDPKSPWQRGTNENTNGLLRQYFPKGADLSAYSQAQLDAVALQLNQRPRKTLGFQTPADKLYASIASTD